MESAKPVAPNPNFPRKYESLGEAFEDAVFFTRRHDRQVEVVENSEGIWLDYSSE